MQGYRYLGGAEIPAPWSYVIMPVMKGLNEATEGDFWTERLPFFTAQFPTYYRKPQLVHGRVHTTNERLVFFQRPCRALQNLVFAGLTGKPAETAFPRA
jgi:hypothetical protein